MHIHCPECGHDHEIADGGIPADTFIARCRGCKARFVVLVVICACGAHVQQGYVCPACEKRNAAGNHELSDPVDVPPYQEMERVVQPGPPARISVSHGVRFSGRGGEFFRIWIVNLFLIIVTLGIYIPWARVRTRQYFYSHTTIAGEPFEYLADPMILLRGYLLIGGGFLIYTVSQAVPVVSGFLVLFFYAFFPFLVFKSLRFYAHNSSFKNIRFQFLGSIAQAYTAYLLLPLAIPLTMGLIVPYWMYYKKRYLFENFAFGGTRCNFSAQVKPFYGFYLKGGLLLLMGFFLVGILAALVIPRLQEIFTAGNMTALAAGAIVMMYGGLILGFIFVQQYIYARTMNYCWGQAVLGSITFVSTLRPGRLLLIQVTNILAIVASVGLLFPWAKVRRTRYILENLTLYAGAGLDDFTAASSADVAALGEAAMDFFDFEIGL